MKINMGCGWRDFGPEWIHIDGGDYPHLDYKDINDLQQIDDETIELIYASHVIEYFDRSEVVDLLKEWKRVLKKGGILRVAVPNFETITDLYNSGAYELDSFIGPLYGKMEMDGKSIFHKTVYDFRSIEKVLKSVGFTNIKQYDWRHTEHSHHDDHSQAYLPHMDKDNGTLISLNVECVK